VTLKLEQKLIKGRKLFVVDLKAGQAKEAKQLEKDGAAVDFNIKQYIMEQGHYGQYTGNARHSKTPITKGNVHAAERDDAAHISYLKRDIDYDAKHGHSDKNMTADEKHISKLAGDMKYDKKHHSPAANLKNVLSGKQRY
jgi:hypothetical protein